MNRQDSLDLLQQCLKQLSEMTEEQFNESLRVKGLAGKEYDDALYQYDSFCVVVEKITQRDMEEKYCLVPNYSTRTSQFYGVDKAFSTICNYGQVQTGCEVSLAA